LACLLLSYFGPSVLLPVLDDEGGSDLGREVFGRNGWAAAAAVAGGRAVGICCFGGGFLGTYLLCSCCLLSCLSSHLFGAAFFFTGFRDSRRRAPSNPTHTRLIIFFFCAIAQAPLSLSRLCLCLLCLSQALFVLFDGVDSG
jgi:hypothetical protein